ncbi:Conserved oligomeric Golgi complex subunit 4 [Hypsibius exemplaris]|uniref:Conserved oligomeric Golgi complex subunit 4 n=1 Tax=Hypsibius exemplaris TaxID=2072580 RepID=A0A1W0WKF7_HYPEX|nr:Conserved oligomeric Golgi complex subunit 4 [Hypsibius exemplaris]
MPRQGPPLAYMHRDEAVQALEKLIQEEEQLAVEIESLLIKKPEIQKTEKELQEIRESLAVLEADSQHMTQTLAFSAQLAESVSGKIRHLDRAKQRVEESLQRIEDILDLRFCTEGVQLAMQNEEYEVAAGHIHRFLKMDESVLFRSAEDMQQQNSLQASLALLHDAQQSLKTIIVAKFDEALNTGDLANVERLFKIFPLLNLHDVGLKKFCTYLCSNIADKAQTMLEHAQKTLQDPNQKKSSTFFVELITKLVEAVAQVVEMYQPLVETYYGSGHLLHFVRFLQTECDRQGLKVVDEFVKHRRFTERARQIRVLVRKTMKSASGGLHSVIDPLELDALLVEATLMNTRVDLYLRFIRKKLMSDFDALDSTKREKENRLKEMNAFLSGCQLSRTMQELIGDYITIEEYYMRQSMKKAISMEQVEEKALTSTMVDDVFFVVRKSIRRALSSASVDGICAILNHAVSLLQEDFADVLHAKLKNNNYVAYTIDLSQAYYSMLGTSTPVDMNLYDKNRKAYLAHLNDADVSMEYLKRLGETLETETSSLLPDISEHDKEKIRNTLQDLTQATHAFQVVVDFGISQLHTAILKPRIKPLVDAFNSVSHDISDEDYGAYEAADPFVENFVFNVRTLLGFFETALRKSNFDLLVKYVGAEIADQLEKAVLKQKYSRLGGIQLDKEVRSLLQYLSSITSWSIRDKFARITQVATILNVDSLVEFQDLWNPSSGITLAWRVTPSEARQILSLRSDFRSDEIKRLKL